MAENELASGSPTSSRRLPVPVTLLSGFLGSGKTTLVKAILEQKESHGKKVAVLVNDMAELNIDAALVKNSHLLQSEERLVEMHNGCICCTLREDLVIELTRLATLEDGLDAILVESTGVSEPQQVAESFTFPINVTEEEEDEEPMREETKEALGMAAELLGRSPETLSDVARLDTCVTVIDCKAFAGDLTSCESLLERYRDRGNGVDEEDDRNISTLLLDQVEFADVILLNKTDLVMSVDEVDRISAAIKILNPDAKIIRTQHSKVDLGEVVQTGKFSLEKAEGSAGWLKSLRGEMVPETEEYGISSFIYRARTPFHPTRLMAFLETMFLVELFDYTNAAEGEEATAEDDTSANGMANGVEDKQVEDKQVEDKQVEDNKVTADSDNQTSLAERNAKGAKNLSHMKSNYGHVYRSKGFLWIAGRNDRCGEWSQAGTIGELSCGGPWMTLFPPHLLPQEGSEDWKIMRGDFQEGILQDRRQELVIIGHELKKDNLIKAFDECLLKESEVEMTAKEGASEDEKLNRWKFEWKESSSEEACPIPEWPSAADFFEELLDEEEEGGVEKHEKHQHCKHD